MSKHDYPELARDILEALGEGEYTKERILKSVELPVNQFTWQGIRTAFAQTGILCHYLREGHWALRYAHPHESAGAMEMWSNQIKKWCKNMRTEFVGLIQVTSDDAPAYVARLVDADMDPTTIYLISEALNGALPAAVESAMRDAYTLVLPDMPAAMRDRIRSRLTRLEQFTQALLTPPASPKN